MKQLFFTILLLMSYRLYSRESELDLLISEAIEKSHAFKASVENSKAHEVIKKRSTKHWLPQVYINAQSFLSNEPGTALFGKLSQREIENSDFLSDSLNDPATEIYTKASLGINLPLYEGGQKVAMNKGFSLFHESKTIESQSIRKDVYIEIVKNYFDGFIYKVEKNELEKIASTIDTMIGRYQVGKRENQLGYSGLLGMKSLKNKTAALLNENSVQYAAAVNAISELTGNQKELSFDRNKDILKQVDEYLFFNKSYTASLKAEAQIKNANGMKELIAAEKSRNLPRIGLFGENSIFKGERGSGNAFSAGIYVSWNIFSSNDYGSVNEAVHKYHIAKSSADAQLQTEKIKYTALKESVGAIQKSLKLIDESESFLSEQTNISNDLFKNGMMSALQYVEVLSRRIELIQTKTKAQEQLISAQAELAKMSGEEAVSGHQ